MTTQRPEAGHEGALVEEHALRTEQAGPDQAAADLLALGRDCAARLTAPWSTVDHGALLYDEKGLPR